MVSLVTVNELTPTIAVLSIYLDDRPFGKQAIATF